MYLFGTVGVGGGGADVVGVMVAAAVVHDAVPDDVVDEVDGAPHVTEHRVAILPRRRALRVPKTRLKTTHIAF